nr:MAG TPA: glycosyltransferase family protein [Caudoviricetes sp.]
MINALSELQDFMKNSGKSLKAASLTKIVSRNHEGVVDTEKFYLDINYSPDEYDKFQQFMNFEYDNAAHISVIHGILWFTDGTYAIRGTQRIEYSTWKF